MRWSENGSNKNKKGNFEIGEEAGKKRCSSYRNYQLIFPLSFLFITLCCAARVNPGTKRAFVELSENVNQLLLNLNGNLAGFFSM